APLVEAVGDHKAALASPPRVAERGLGRDSVGTRIERRDANLDVLGPPRDEAPSHDLGDALAIDRVGCDQHRSCWRDVPRWLKVRRWGVRTELEPDLDL